MQRIIDISLPLSASMPVYPGTAPTTIETITSPSGNTLSVITLTSHAGTHVDAPSHSVTGAPAVDEIPLQTFYGTCRVVDVTHCKEYISAEDLQVFDIKMGERILLKTNNSLRGYETFYDDYVFLSSEGAKYLASCGVVLVGIDSLSIKQRGSADNTPHTHLLSKNIPILEGLDLGEVQMGEYQLCAFPLAFTGIDGSPLRAVLFEI